MRGFVKIFSLPFLMDNRNYREILNTTYKDNFDKLQGPPGDVYNALMGKEQSTLDIVNRIVNYNQQHKEVKSTFFSMTLAELLTDFVVTLSDIIAKLFKMDSLKEFATYVVSDNKFVLYIGLCVAMVAILLMIIEYA